MIVCDWCKSERPIKTKVKRKWHDYPVLWHEHQICSTCFDKMVFYVVNHKRIYSRLYGALKELRRECLMTKAMKDRMFAQIAPLTRLMAEVDEALASAEQAGMK